jgi:hypothetical protein
MLVEPTLSADVWNTPTPEPKTCSRKIKTLSLLDGEEGVKMLDASVALAVGIDTINNIVMVCAIIKNRPVKIAIIKATLSSEYPDFLRLCRESAIKSEKLTDAPEFILLIDWLVLDRMPPNFRSEANIKIKLL